MSDTRDYLLDTNMLGHLARAKTSHATAGDITAQRVADTLKEVRSNPNRRVFISSITIGESEYGLLTAPNSDAIKQADARRVVDAFLPDSVLHVDNVVARDYYASLRAKLFTRYAPKDKRGLAKSSYLAEWMDPVTQKQLGVQDNDVWIAATAMAYNLTLVSADRLHNIREVAGNDLSYETWA